MATHDYVIDNSTGANVRADINNVLQAILTNNSSSSAPSTTAAYMFWADTTSGTLKIRNSSDNAWVELLQLDGTLTLEDGSQTAPALAFRDDLNTGIYSDAADTFNIATAGVGRLEIDASEITFNDSGADTDFRVESDTNTHAIFLQASNSRIGINTSSPNEALEVTGNVQVTSGDLRINSSNPIVKLTDTDASSGFAAISNNSTTGSLKLSADDGAALANSTILFEVDGSQKMQINKDGKVSIGSSATDTGTFLIDKNITAESDASDTANYHLVIRSQSNSNTSKVGIAFKNSSDSTVVGAAILHHRTAGGSVGDLAFYTSPSTGTTEQRMVIDKKGHVGIGVTPNDVWPDGDFRALQIGTGACVFGRGSGDEDRGGLAVNYYATGSGNKFLANGHANLVYLNDGNIDFYTSAQNTSGANADLSLLHVMQINTSKNVEIKDGDLIIGTAGHGIDFSAQTATSASGATTSSELLDHYEEGTFTPFNPSLTATDLQGHYTRVGRVVHASIFITIPSNSNGNSFVIDGLPFNTFNPDPSVGASLQGGYVIYSNYSAAVLVRTNQGGDRIVVNSIGGNNILLTNLDNISFRIGLHYFTT